MSGISLVGVPIVVVGVALIGYVFAIRSKYHYTSRLTCPKCNGAFDYKWVPGASFSTFRLGRDRYLKCPGCSEWSTFDVMSTRVGKAQKEAAPAY
ncbi:MAG: hypothetical protein JRM73_00030 [Nitrososphaerota archaeon]|nr:hypothetical protein [Nitrososphaerota archaeon]